MPIFKYRARNQHSESVQGKVEANSRQQAATLIQSRGLFLVDLKAAEETGLARIQQFSNKVGLDDTVNMTRQLSTMVTAGLPLVDALRILEQQGKPVVKKLIGDLVRDIESGTTFAQALEKHPQVFGRVYVQLVRAGEAGGVLDEVMDRLAENMEKAKDFRGKTRGALIYPAVVILAMIVVASIMMIFVIPKLSEMYVDFGADLPFATRLLINTSSFFAKFWWLIAMIGVGGFFGLQAWGRTDDGRHAIDRFWLKMPIVGVLIQKTVLTEFARTLSLLLSAGISLLQALQIVTEAMDNIIYRDALQKASQQVEKGVSLGQSIGAYEIFPPILFQMIVVGEETGKLDEILLKLSKYFEAETEQAVKNLTTAVEPMIMVVLGLMVGVMVIAIIMPIYNLTSQF